MYVIVDSLSKSFHVIVAMTFREAFEGCCVAIFCDASHKEETINIVNGSVNGSSSMSSSVNGDTQNYNNGFSVVVPASENTDALPCLEDCWKRSMPPLTSHL